jgi:predicted nucleotidyltransferase component of viral defense system
MILPKPEDALHKAQLYRLVGEILDCSSICQSVYFKGGTCAGMLGFLDRFSLDLDFDLKKDANQKIIGREFLKIFERLNLEVKQKSRTTLFYVLKYRAKLGLRNTLKLSLIDKALRSNVYASFYLKEIDRFAICQTKETMFANKLVAVTDRYKKYKTIAGRDIYDAHYFFSQGYRYVDKVIKERTGIIPIEYFRQLKKFVENKVTQTIITQDLSYLLPHDQFKLTRKVLKKELVMFLADEIARLN